MSVALSALTLKLTEKLFPAQLAEVTKALEEECGQNLPFCENGTPESLERLRFAVLKVGMGNMDDFRKGIAIAKQDWRDLLVWAKFAENVKAHELWAKQILEN